ncbi:MAG: DUF4248 domain-containing protein [Mediterranea massiliensis]|nr:DUF4248 domain-containing protein [Mediterranea massiliensis]
MKTLFETPTNEHNVFRSSGSAVEVEAAEPFIVRAMSKKELAACYYPGLSEATQMKKLRADIKGAPGLEQELFHDGKAHNNQHYNRYQVMLIVKRLGPP